MHATPDPKPAHLARSYGEQFEDPAVAIAYHTRAPYPDELFEVLERLLPARPRRVLDLGCGTGDVALGLVGRAERIDAIDSSAAMLRVARSRSGGDDPGLRWVHVSAESFHYEPGYSLVVAAESLHWTEWDVVLPRISAALAPGAFLAIVSGRGITGVAWAEELSRLVSRYSTNRDYRPYDLIAELVIRRLFRETNRWSTRPVAFSQPVDDYLESFHTRNGLTRERMTLESAAAFDDSLRRVVSRHCSDGVVRGTTRSSVVWGVPLDPRAATESHIGL